MFLRSTPCLTCCSILLLVSRRTSLTAVYLSNPMPLTLLRWPTGRRVVPRSFQDPSWNWGWVASLQRLRRGWSPDGMMGRWLEDYGKMGRLWWKHWPDDMIIAKRWYSILVPFFDDAKFEWASSSWYTYIYICIILYIFYPTHILVHRLWNLFEMWWQGGWRIHVSFSGSARACFNLSFSGQVSTYSKFWSSFHLGYIISAPRRCNLFNWYPGVQDFFDREDLDCGVAPLREKTAKTSASRDDGWNYALLRWCYRGWELKEIEGGCRFTQRFDWP